MTIDLSSELRTIALTKALTDRVEARGCGMWMTEPEPCWSACRATVYRLAGIDSWSEAEDEAARRRLAIWNRHVRKEVA